MILTFGAEFGEQLSIPGAGPLVLTAEARVGRPLTPVSVGGVARRTVRRCAVGVYNCSLPTQALNNLVAQTSTVPDAGKDSKHGQNFVM